MKKIFLLSLVATMGYFTVKAQNAGLSKDNYVIYSTKDKKVVDIETLINDAKNYDVIFYGEEHNDSVTHYLEATLFKMLYEKYNSVALSLEMFNREDQVVLDEYLHGIIKESHFKKDGRVWGNYRDYRPMIEFAKENKIDVVAGNAPMRYVSMANKQSQQALVDNLSAIAKTWICPLPYDTATGDYYNKLRDIMGYNNHDAANAAMMQYMPKSLCGHSLWDATMAYSISEYVWKNPGKKMFQVNGRFHSDEKFGIVQQLKKYSPYLKSLVISTSGQDKDFPKIKFDQYQHLGDYIIVTDPNVPKTYKE